MRRRVAVLLLPLVAVGVIAFLARFGLSGLETGLLYFPLRHHLAQPEHFGLSAEELRPSAQDGTRLHGWWLRAQASPPAREGSLAAADRSGVAAASRPVVIWFSGNGGNVSGVLENARRLINRLDVDIIAVDYRGYGHSEGAPSEAGLYLDGRAIYDAVRERGVPAERIVLFGRSLGAAVATDVALDRPIAGLVLETPFLSVPAVARAVYPFIPGFLVQSRYDNERKLPHIAVPKLIIQAERDEVVPASHAHRLYDVAAPPKRLHVLTGSRHNDTFDEQRPAYIAAWRALLAEATGSQLER